MTVLLPTRRIGNTTLAVTELGFGAASLGNLYRIVSDSDAKDTATAAIEAGIAYFDTAPYYGLGLSERRIGDVLRGHHAQLVWGPGRHGPGNNLFTYHVDSTGALVEYFADILRIENEETYQWRDWSDVPEWNNIWGPLPPDNFREYGVGLAT